jgi:Asp-tRNA(Asn)/Glu-tRNA(Gln) amidotransferase A subunit family amidase
MHHPSPGASPAAVPYPALPFVAPPAVTDDTELRAAANRFSYPFNALGWPALALPCGLAEHGLPASIRLVAGDGEDALVPAAGDLVERALTARM